jgi:molecular chaperone DnaK (HSP70)
LTSAAAPSTSRSASIAGNDINVLATSGDHQLGGKDWDDRLITFAAEAFPREAHLRSP